VRHAMHYGAATCRRDYHPTCDFVSQHVPELRPGRSDCWVDIQSGTDLRMQELNQRMQQLNHQRGADLLRTSYWHNAEHQQQGLYQQRHRFAPHFSSMIDHTNTLGSWTTRAPQYDMNYPRSGVVAWN